MNGDDRATRYRRLGDGDLGRGKPDAFLHHSDRGIGGLANHRSTQQGMAGASGRSRTRMQETVMIPDRM
jgi:hypothetical protein